MNRRWLLAGTVAVLLGAILYMFDHGRAASGLAAAYTVRDAGERALSEMASTRESSPPGAGNGEDPRSDRWAEASRKAAASIHAPILLGRRGVRAMEAAAKQYDDLIRRPPGAWLTLTREIADRRSRLDAAITTVETQLVSPATKEEMLALSRGDVARIRAAIAAAQPTPTPAPEPPPTTTAATP
jgi:hypothetical protein